MSCQGLGATIYMLLGAQRDVFVQRGEGASELMLNSALKEEESTGRSGGQGGVSYPHVCIITDA